MTGKKPTPALQVVARDDPGPAPATEPGADGWFLRNLGPVSDAELVHVLADIAELKAAIRQFTKVYTPRLARRVLSEEMKALDQRLDQAAHRPRRAGLPDNRFLAITIWALELRELHCGLPQSTDAKIARSIKEKHNDHFNIQSTASLAKRVGSIRKQAKIEGWDALIKRAEYAAAAKEFEAAGQLEMADELFALTGLRPSGRNGEWGHRILRMLLSAPQLSMSEGIGGEK